MDELEPQLSEESVIEWLRTEMRRAYAKEMLEQLTGPFVYGDGNFEVYQDEDQEWGIRAKPEWTPPNLQGIEYFRKE